jgi:hypothetical protein
MAWVKKNSVSQISDYLRRNMEAVNIKTIKRPLFTITLTMAPEKVVIDNKDEIPDELVKVVTSVEPDKRAIAEQLKDIRQHNKDALKRIESEEEVQHELRTEPSWAHLERGENSIRIK